MEQRGHEISFPPVVSPRAEILILGSYPSPKSFEYGFYYGHPQNRFWPLAAHLAGCATPKTIDEKKALVLNSRIALWDALERCRIQGASDASISDAIPNDIASLIQRTGIKAVYCNGAASHRFYTRFCRQQTGLDATCLPSTSPANAAFTWPRLLNAWQPLAPYFIPD